MQARLRAAGDDGAAAVEFAIVSVLLFSVLFGIMVYGYGFFQLQGAQATAQVAARRASRGELNACSDWQGVVSSAMAGNGVNISNYDATVTITPAIVGNPVPRPGDALVVTYEYTPGLRLPFVPFPDRLTARASTSVETPGDLTAFSCSVTIP